MTCPLHLHSVLASQTVCSFVCSQRGLMSAVAAVAMEMKESYLDWSYSTGGYKKARKTFTRLKTSHVVYSHVNLNDIRHTHKMWFESVTKHFNAKMSCDEAVDFKLVFLLQLKGKPSLVQGLFHQSDCDREGTSMYSSYCESFTCESCTSVLSLIDTLLQLFQKTFNYQKRKLWGFIDGGL